MKITHLSVTVENPENVATILAELTDGKASPFRFPFMEGAYVCMWGNDRDELIEFLPNGYIMHPTDLGANFQKTDQKLPYNSTHFQLRCNQPLEKIKEISDKHGCHHYLRASKRKGGPLYEVWIEKFLLVELTSEEIDLLAVE